MSESNDNSKIIELPFSEVKPEHLGRGFNRDRSSEEKEKG